MFFYRSKQLIKAFGAFVLTLFLCLAVSLLGRFSFPQKANAQEYYLYSVSSQATRKTEIEITDTLFLEGVSCEYTVTDGEEFAWEQIRRYRAVVVLTEEIGNIRSYYCYSPMLGKTVTVDGDKINLHIVVKGVFVKMGSPLIFGGY